MQVKNGGQVLRFGNAKGNWFYDGRISLSVLYFDNEKDADLISKNVVKAGCSYNGGWFDGTPCGREVHRDYTDAFGIKWYAVTC
jgi:hypothetical protein